MLLLKIVDIMAKCSLQCVLWPAVATLLHHVIGCQGDHMTHEQEKKVTWVLICIFQPFNLIVWEILESHVSTLYNELMIERKQINVLFIDLPNVLPSMKLPLMLKFWYCENIISKGGLQNWYLICLFIYGCYPHPIAPFKTNYKMILKNKQCSFILGFLPILLLFLWFCPEKSFSHCSSHGWNIIY